LTNKRKPGEGISRQGAKERPKLKSSHEEVRRGTGRAQDAGTFRAHLGRRARNGTLPLPGPRMRKARPSLHPSGTSVASDRAREMAIAIAIAALEKKAVGVEILDVAGKVDYADFLVIMTGRSDRQVQALAQGIEEALRRKNKRPLSVEGLPHASWVLMDYGDVVVHVFQDDARNLYDIEGLWMDARRLPVPAPEDVS
jgi:ribosome-associated protein